MKKKIVIGSLLVIFMLIFTTIPFTGATTNEIEKTRIVGPTPSYVDAIAYVRGTISDLEFDGSYIRFHAERVLVIALASAGCSFIRTYQDQNVSVKNKGYVGYIGSNYIYVLIKTVVAGPI